MSLRRIFEHIFEQISTSHRSDDLSRFIFTMSVFQWKVFKSPIFDFDRQRKELADTKKWRQNDCQIVTIFTKNFQNTSFPFVTFEWAQQY